MDMHELIGLINNAAVQERILFDPETRYSPDAAIGGAWIAFNLALKERIRALNEEQRQREPHRRRMYSDLIPDTMMLTTTTAGIIQRGIRQAHAENRFGGATATAPLRRIEDAVEHDRVRLTGNVTTLTDDGLGEGIIDEVRLGHEMLGTITDVDPDDDGYHYVTLDFDGANWAIRFTNLELVQ